MHKGIECNKYVLKSKKRVLTLFERAQKARAEVFRAEPFKFETDFIKIY